MENWIEVVKKLMTWFLALLWNGVLAYMLIINQDIPVWFWAVYGPVMASVGIPIIYQGFKTMKGDR